LHPFDFFERVASTNNIEPDFLVPASGPYTVSVDGTTLTRQPAGLRVRRSGRSGLAGPWTKNKGTGSQLRRPACCGHRTEPLRHVVELEHRIT
jgi:hypothetical protein